MSKRKRFSERDVIETLWHQGVRILCFRCGHSLYPFEDAIEREHLHEVELGGADKPYNCRYSHKACHAKVTNGTPATTAGSSKHKIAKVKRIAKGKMAVNWRDDGTAYYVPAKRKRKLKGRGFQTKPEGYKHRWSLR